MSDCCSWDAERAMRRTGEDGMKTGFSCGQRGNTTPGRRRVAARVVLLMSSAASRSSNRRFRRRYVPPPRPSLGRQSSTGASALWPAGRRPPSPASHYAGASTCPYDAADWDITSHQFASRRSSPLHTSTDLLRLLYATNSITQRRPNEVIKL